MKKTDIINLVCVLIMALGYSNDNNIVFLVGLFALSGAVTNTLAIHMLFDKVPYLYGSGVIEQKFSTFTKSIYDLIMNQFFTKENLNKFFNEEINSSNQNIDIENLISKTDFSPAFISLKDTVVQSPFGAALEMFGGEKALDGLKEPFINKLKASVVDISKTKEFQDEFSKSLSSSEFSSEVHTKISQIVENRLIELTPKMVKEIVQEMIKEHLTWLVIWGAVFGGLFGLVGALVL